MRKQILLLLVASIGILPLYAAQEVETDKKEQKSLFARDITYMGLGIACWGSALLTVKLTMELMDVRKAINLPGTFDGTAECAELLKTFSALAHYWRWQRWYGEKSNIGGSIEVFGSGLLCACFGIAGMHFMAKGLHLKDCILSTPKAKTQEI